MIPLILLTALFASLTTQVVLSADASSGQVLLSENFDQRDEKGFAASALKHKSIRLAQGAGPDGSDAICVDYVGFERGSQRVIVYYPLDSKVLQATLSFDVRFASDFQWVMGGKLHGFAPTRPITGGIKRLPDGWSARIMFMGKGKCRTYLYDQDTTKKYGIGHPSKMPVFQAGQWHHVVFEVRLNTPGKANGSSRILIDNQEVVYTKGVEFRGEGGPDTEIQQFLFCTFHGGNAPKWTPVDEKGNPTTVHAWFDNFVVREGIHTL